MNRSAQSNQANLPTLLAALRQDAADGELVLEHNDGARRLYFCAGELVFLQSDVAGEQFGNYLLRRGVLDFAALGKLLANDERFRLGEKVVQWGLLTVPERDGHLRRLQEQVMINALEHPIVALAWHPGAVGGRLSEDLQLKLDHRHFIWTTFQEAHPLPETFALLVSSDTWKWEGRPNLLEALEDLPLDPATAYALSFLGSEPISFQTFLALSSLPEEAATRVLLSLWAVGTLTLTQGALPSPMPAIPAAPAAPAAADPAGDQPPGVPPSAAQVPPVPPSAVPAPAAPLAQAPAPPSPPPVPLPAPSRPAATPAPAPSPAPAEPPAPPPAAAPVQPRSARTPEPAFIQPEFLAHDDAEGSDPSDPFQPDTASHTRARHLFRKARQLELQDRTGEAIRSLELAVQLDPASPSAYGAWMLLGRLRMSNPAWSTRAISAFQSAAQVRPKAAEPWVAMGEVYFRKAFRTNAWACFHKAIELDPSVPIPPEVDLRTLDPPPEPEPEPPATLFSRFKSMLGSTPKK